MTSHPDARARAFEALLPTARAVRSAIDSAQARTLKFRADNELAWAGWTTAQQAAALGSARFSWVVYELKVELAPVREARFFSTKPQELMNLFLWLVEPGLGLRVKRDPAELSPESSETLFDLAPATADQTACLTWDVEPDGRISSERFIAGHGAFWSIALGELLAEVEARIVTSIAAPTVKVESARGEEREELAPGDESSWGMATNHLLLRLAREAAGRTQSDLAKASGVAQGSISKYEKGLQVPTPAQVEALASALGLPVAFFEQADVRPATVLYRSRSLRSARLETMVRGRLNLARLVVAQLLDEITADHVSRFPEPDQMYASPEHAAAALRRAWGAVPGPIESVSNLIENAGGVVVRLDLGTDLVNAAFMHPLGDRFRWFFVNTRVRAGDRIRFSLAHELGHAVLHETAMIPESKEAETESHRFAAAFLTPFEDLRVELPRGSLQVSDLMVLKRRFGVSMQSIIMSAYRGGSLTARERERLFRQFSSKGWRLNEPGEVPVEEPGLLREALRIHRVEHGYTDDDLAELARVPLATLSSLLPDYFVPKRDGLRVVSREGAEA